jgi:hypothetical protein
MTFIARAFTAYALIIARRWAVCASKCLARGILAPSACHLRRKRMDNSQKFAQLGIAVMLLGGVIAFIGLFPSVIGSEASQGVGVLQVLDHSSRLLNPDQWRVYLRSSHLLS